MLTLLRKTTIAVIAAILFTTFGQQLILPASLNEVGATSLEPKSEKSKREFDHHSGRKHMSKEEIMELKLEKMRQLATQFGIDPSGKSFQQLKQELSDAKNENPAKWQAIKNEYHAKKIARLREYAESKGISVEGKSTEQIREELEKLSDERKKD